MARHDPRGDLAPRDIVARAVDWEMRESGEAHVWLDATGMPRGRLEERFPHILQGCVQRGIDPRNDPIPVVPAAHYMCGGVWTDRDGQTTLPGLYAVGECACTGVHGANRLASNSLLEAVVFAERAAARLLQELPFTTLETDVSAASSPPPLSSLPEEKLVRLRERIRNILWERLGMIRELESMERGATQLEGLRREWWEAASRDSNSAGGSEEWREESAETLNMIEVARLMVRCALWRRESRGLHFVREYPYRDNERFLGDTVIEPSV